MRNNADSQPRWFYPLIYGLLVIINLLPSYAQKPYSPEDSQDVILSLLQISIEPYKAFGWVFHLVTLLIIILILIYPGKLGRVVAGYMGVNYIVIAFTQSMGMTEKYGFVLHTGAFLTSIILGITWLGVAWKRQLSPTLGKPSWVEFGLVLFCFLAFWAPYSVSNGIIQPEFDFALLLTSPDYGLTFCFTTPLFLLGLVLFYPHVNKFAYHVTAFSGLLFAVFNLTHWFDPSRRWMGFLHLPLMVVSIYALLLPRLTGFQQRFSFLENMNELVI